MKLSVDTLITAPREKVFAMLLDVERWPGAISAIRKVEVLTPGPVQVGTRFRETRFMLGREATEEMTFSEIVPPERVVLTAENHGTRYRVLHTFHTEGGATRARIVFSGEPVTWAARILSVLAVIMKGHVERQLAADLNDLKRAAEAAG